MKKILVILSLFLLVVACSSSSKQEALIKLKEKKGEVVSITLDEFVEKMKQKESFVVLFSQTNCGGCMYFFSETDAYTESFGLTLYDVKLDKETYSVQEVLDILGQFFTGFSVTPTLYIIKEGEMYAETSGKDSPLDLDKYKQFLDDNKVIFGK